MLLITTPRTLEMTLHRSATSVDKITAEEWSTAEWCDRYVRYSTPAHLHSQLRGALETPLQGSFGRLCPHGPERHFPHRRSCVALVSQEKGKGSRLEWGSCVLAIQASACDCSRHAVTVLLPRVCLSFRVILLLARDVYPPHMSATRFLYRSKIDIRRAEQHENMCSGDSRTVDPIAACLSMFCNTLNTSSSPG